MFAETWRPSSSGLKWTSFEGRDGRLAPHSCASEGSRDHNKELGVWRLVDPPAEHNDGANGRTSEGRKPDAAAGARENGETARSRSCRAGWAEHKIHHHQWTSKLSVIWNCICLFATVAAFMTKISDPWFNWIIIFLQLYSTDAWIKILCWHRYRSSLIA